jgi:hypothetical protein
MNRLTVESAYGPKKESLESASFSSRDNEDYLAFPVCVQPIYSDAATFACLAKGPLTIRIASQVDQENGIQGRRSHKHNHQQNRRCHLPHCVTTTTKGGSQERAPQDSNYVQGSCPK